MYFIPIQAEKDKDEASITVPTTSEALFILYNVRLWAEANDCCVTQIMDIIRTVEAHK